LIIIVCDGVKNQIVDDEVKKNSVESITSIITNLIKEEINSKGNEDIIENLNFKLFDMNLMICTDTKISVTDLNLSEMLSR